MQRTYILLFFLLIVSPLIPAQDLGTLGSQDPVRFSGSLEVRGMAYSANGISNRRQPFTWYLFGSPTLTIYGITIPFSFALSEENKTFSQPFNQYGMSPRYKWITLHLGYRNVNFSPYTLGGHTLYGAGVELTPGLFRFGAMYGRLNKATQLDTNLGYIRPISFTRKAYAMKIGIGRKNNFLDFSFLKAEDDSSSVRSQAGDSSAMVFPAANLAGSATLRLKITPRLQLDADGGLSLYTNNMRSENPIKELSQFNDILPINLSTEKFMAWTAGLTYREKYFSLKANYKWVEPGFKSMGVYFFQSDVEQISLSPAFQLFKNRARFQGSFGLQTDNLRNQKSMTTRRTIWSASTGLDFSKQLGLDVNLNNYSMNSTPEVSLINNKYKLTNTSRTLSAGPRYILVRPTTSHALIGNYTDSELSDANDSTTAINTIRNKMFFLSYNLGLLKKNTSLSFSCNQSRMEYRGTSTEYLGFSLGLSKSFLDNKLQLGSSFSYTLSNSEAGSNILNLSLNTQYNLSKHHRFSLRWALIHAKAVNPAFASSFTESTGEIAYHFTF